MAKRDNLSQMVMKAMGLFGGVQILGVLCSIVRTKLVALWIGPVGVGLFGLFNNALEMINTAAGLGVRNSSVRDISQALETGNRQRLALVITVVRRWSFWLGLAGALLTLLLSPLLSQITFGNTEYVWGFVALSIAVLLGTLSNGEQAVLQGSSQLRRLATANLWGTVAGLLVSIPLFYGLRERSVLPSILAYAVATALALWFLRNKAYPAAKATRVQTLTVGRDFVRLGIFMTIGTFASILASYVFNAWLNHHAGTQAVGYYQAGYTLIIKYTGLILSALGMEYYPRLARVVSHRERLRVFVSQELNVTLLVMVPVVALFIVLREWIVVLLYRADFITIIDMVSWGMLGALFRAISWCMSFVMLAKGDGRTYVVTEVASAAIGLALNVSFYHLWGLTGLGLSFLAWYVIYTIIVAYVYYVRYGLSLSRGSVGGMCWAVAAVGGVVASMQAHCVVLAIALVLISLTVSAHQLLKSWKR